MIKTVWNGEWFLKELKQKRLVEDNIDMRSLAKKINISPSTISRCENGHMPDLDSYAKLCHYIGQPMDAFIKIDGKKKK